MYIRRLKDIREDRDMTQKEIAEYLKITQQQYSLYENGKRTLPVDLLVELSKLYNLSTDYILGLSNDITIKNNVNYNFGSITMNWVIKLIKRYLIYYFIGELTNVFKQPFETGELIINNGRYIIINLDTSKQIEIKNIFRITKESIGVSTVIRIDTMNTIIYICAASRLFPISDKTWKQISNNRITRKIFKDMKK